MNQNVKEIVQVFHTNPRIEVIETKRYIYFKIEMEVDCLICRMDRRSFNKLGRKHFIAEEILDRVSYEEWEENCF